MQKSRKKYEARFKSEVVMNLLSNKFTIRELSDKYQLHQSVILRWKNEFLENSHLIFEKNPDETFKEKEELIDSLYKTIGQRDIELEWLKKKVGYFSR